jgi:putative transposase
MNPKLGVLTSSSGGLVTSPPTASSPAKHPGQLPRLDTKFYRGDSAVHWTLTVFNRATGWLKESFHSAFRELMQHTAAREGLFCPAYCLMPDHIHLLWLGLRHDTDQRNGMSFLRTHLEPRLSPHRFQPQAHDHVLRDEERQRDAFTRICFYILVNPVRAGLIRETETWPFCGAVIPGYPVLPPLAEDFWPKFWRLYQQHRQPGAGEWKRPLRSSQKIRSGG